MFEVFPVMRDLHELLWYVSEALTFPAANPLLADLARALDETERLTHQSPAVLIETSATSSWPRASWSGPASRTGRTIGEPTSSGPTSKAPTCGGPV